MLEKINWSLNAAVVGGPKISLAKTTEVDAYDKNHVEIGPGTADVEVDIQPGDAAGQVLFLLISSDLYDAKLTYKVNDTSASPITLDGPHFLVGTGAVGLLGVDAPTTLYFSNAITDKKASVEILVGRYAAAPASA